MKCHLFVLDCTSYSQASTATKQFFHISCLKKHRRNQNRNNSKLREFAIARPNYSPTNKMVATGVFSGATVR